MLVRDALPLRMIVLLFSWLKLKPGACVVWGTALGHHTTLYFLRLTEWVLTHHSWLLMITLTTTNSGVFFCVTGSRRTRCRKTSPAWENFSRNTEAAWKLNNGSTCRLKFDAGSTVECLQERFSGVECEPTWLNILCLVNHEDFKILPLKILWA